MASASSVNNRIRPSPRAAVAAGAGAADVGSVMGASVMSEATARVSQIMNELVDQQILYTKRIRHEKQKIAAIDRRIAQAEQRTTKYRTQFLEAKGKQTTSRMQEVAIRRLEDKLDRTLQRLHQKTRLNESKVQEINDYRIEKATQRTVKEGVQRELNQKRDKLKNMLSVAQHCIADKDNVQRATEALRTQISEDLDAFNGEYETMLRDIKEQSVFNSEIMSNAGRGAHSPFAALQGSPNRPGGEGKKDTESGIQLEVLRKSVAKQYWGIAKRKLDLEELDTNIVELEGNLDRLKSSTGVTDVKELIPILQSSEEQNYSLYNMINDLTKEMEELEVEKQTLDKEMSKYQDIAALQAENRQRIKRDLEEQIRKSRMQTEKNDLDYARGGEKLHLCTDGISNIFNKVGCNDEGLAQQLTSTGITDRNIMVFLGAIEDRVNEIVQLYNVLVANNTIPGGPGGVGGDGNSPPASPLRPLPPKRDKGADVPNPQNLPSINDADDEEDDRSIVSGATSGITGIHPVSPRLSVGGDARKASKAKRGLNPRDLGAAH